MNVWNFCLTLFAGIFSLWGLFAGFLCACECYDANWGERSKSKWKKDEPADYAGCCKVAAEIVFNPVGLMGAVIIGLIVIECVKWIFGFTSGDFRM